MCRRAFTLFELLLVIVLLGVVIAYALPNWNPYSASSKLTESADRMRSTLVMMRARAMNEGIRYRIWFPGTPDPLDPFADMTDVEVPLVTEQPIIEREADPLNEPEQFSEVDRRLFVDGPILQDGTRCISVRPGRPHIDVNEQSVLAGPSLDEPEFVQVTFNPDGTSDWASFVLTSLPYDEDFQLEPYHATRIISVMLDGRTGQIWLQRALMNEEVELLKEYQAPTLLRVDFLQPDPITEENILTIRVRGREISAG